VLAPLLFLVYINDLPTYMDTNKVSIAMLADDVALWPVHRGSRTWNERYEAMRAALNQWLHALVGGMENEMEQRQI
jgi:hypothetical protein